MDFVAVIGTAAALCSTASFVPQAWKIVRTRDTSAISTGMYAVTVAGFALWTAYGVLLMQWPIIVTNIICFVLASFILTMKTLPRAKKEAVADAIRGEHRDS